MTKQDQAELAKILKRTRGRRMIAYAIADYCRKVDPTFNRDRFLIGAGVKRM